MSDQKNNSKPDFINPIDKDKVAENPGILPYAHTTGSAVVKADDIGKIKGRAVSAMHQQTEMQMKQIYIQMELLATQAKELQDRINISERIYGAEMRFEPLIAHTYHLYQNKKGVDVLTMVGPDDWGRNMPYKSFIATVKLLSDHTWEILTKADDFD